MSSLLFQTIDQLSREKGIEPQIIISAVEDAILVAARKYYKTGEELRSELNRETGQVELYAVKKVVEQVQNPLREINLEEARQLDTGAQLESEIRFSKPTDVLGRVAAQTAKQVIFQKLREAERENVYNEYSGRVGELVHCVVKRTEGPDLILELGKTEARIPRREQSKLESFQIGERIRAIILQVEKSARGPQVIVSRADSSLVSRLFEMEVPEIYDGTVVIRAVAREAGERTKIAVFSKDRDVDCVGACVGMKGMRVQSIIRELRGEKIDIVEYNEDPSSFAAHSLSPAKINRVTVLDQSLKHMEVIVDDTQLSLAIGKKGQNVRLASKLLGWRIDIKSEEEKRQEVETQMEQLMPTGTGLNEVSGIGAKTTEKLIEHGITTVERLGEMTPEQLQEIPGIGPKMVEKIRLAINNYYMQFEEPAGETVEAVAVTEAQPVEAATPAAEAVAETPPVEAKPSAEKTETASDAETASDEEQPQETESLPEDDSQ